MASTAVVLASADPVQLYYSPTLRMRYRPVEPELSAVRPGVVYADVKFRPEKDRYDARTEARVRAGGLQTEVPAGWPRQLKGPLDDEGKYVHCLSTVEKAEIVSALAYVKGKGLESPQVTRETFPLPALGKYLDSASKEVYEGQGLVTLRGLDVDDFSSDDLAAIYLGLSGYIAERRGKQGHRGTTFMHVFDQKIPRECEYLAFHTDAVCDVLGLLLKESSVTGGEIVLASAWTVYNEMAATRPDLIHTLARPDWPFDTFGRDPPYYKRALLYFHEDKLFLNFSRRLLCGSMRTPRSKGIPGLTEAQAEALDALHFIAQKHQIQTSMKKGDIRFINNMGIMHAREAFDYMIRFEGKRHLLRLWLNKKESMWKLSPRLDIAWARVFDDDERQSYWDISPPMKDDVLMRVAESCD